jgi:hypothetical protein
MWLLASATTTGRGSIPAIKELKGLARSTAGGVKLSRLPSSDMGTDGTDDTDGKIYHRVCAFTTAPRASRECLQNLGNQIIAALPNVKLLTGVFNDFRFGADRWKN